MKYVKLSLQVLKVTAKYGAYIFVIVDIVNYAVERIENEIQKNQENESK